ncbi:S8 family serine peptidase [Usitatibacter palustris]|uniref:Peptidase S8/S53 domain-containing protein n=1 Tax=Usitatibacter palustris TaxID=2732487 RepID=A0A6M4H6R0_9PROT|nr:S8 family serine peptidase [Usitatibacter palustris]QJR15052.1 hypothetical protein DSM104440_01868 [Usitatibacter palustris]
MKRALLAVCALASIAYAQTDPLSLPTPRPSPGAYQWGIEMLKFDKAWEITRGRAHLAFSERDEIGEHEDLRAGIDGPLRRHISMPMAPPSANPDGSGAAIYHATLTVGVAAARGQNGRGISGACPFCAVSLHDGARFPVPALVDALASGATAINYSSLLEPGARTCGGSNESLRCPFLRNAEARDVVFAIIAHNMSMPLPGDPGILPSTIVVGGLQYNGQFWTQGYDPGNTGSNYGPTIRLVAPARDVLSTHIPGATYGTLAYRCGDRVNSLVGEGVSLGPEYSGYGTCHGTSFSAPFVIALAGLMRSANPLLTAQEVRTIIYETATTPVAGPAGTGYTYYIPDAEAAVRRAIGPGVRNRLTPMFTLYAPATRQHIFTTSVQTALAAAAGELRSKETTLHPVFESFGNPIPGYPQFSGRLCDDQGLTCRNVPARSLFSVFTTENSPDGRPLVPLYRMSYRHSISGGASFYRTFYYATSEAEVRERQNDGYFLDVVEGFVYSPEGAPPPGALRLCPAFDAPSPGFGGSILYAAATCDRGDLRNAAGETTGGAYHSSAHIGYVPAQTTAASNYTAMWWNAAESGWGVNVSHQGNTLFATMFTYDAAGNPLWLSMSNGTQGAGETFSGRLYRTTGSAFNANPFVPIGPANITDVGSMSFAFTGDSGTLTYTFNGTTVTKAITKYLFGTRVANCVATTGDRTGLTNYQDLWWNAAESGWGLNITHQDNTLFATMFNYNAAGQGVWWIMSSGPRQTDGSYLGTLYQTTGPPFNANPFTPIGPANIISVGTMRLTFATGTTATLTYTVNGVSVTKTITRYVLGASPPACS